MNFDFYGVHPKFGNVHITRNFYGYLCYFVDSNNYKYVYRGFVKECVPLMRKEG
jgi:hypothetical protein